MISPNLQGQILKQRARWSVFVWCFVVICSAAPAHTMAAGATSLHPQDGPHVDVRVHVLDDAVQIRVSMNLVFMGHMVDVAMEQPDVLSPVEVEGAGALLRAYFAEHHPLSIDGIRVEPVMSQLESPEADSSLLPLFPISGMRGLQKINFTLRYPIKTEPQSINFVWQCFPPDILVDPDEPPPLIVSAELTIAGRLSLITFTKDEPAHTWHAPLDIGERAIVELPRPPDTAVARWRLPIGTIIFGLISLLFLIATLRRFTRGRMVGTVVTAAIAGLSLPFTVVEIDDPTASGPTFPTTEEASAIFEPLHANIYRAFDYASESDIYDALSQSVHGSLLDQLYREVYHSLVMIEEGGAVSRVSEVRVGSVDVEQIGLVNVDGRDVVGFTVLARWQVDGYVYHWGHTHERTNAYAARYSVVGTDDGWRLDGNEVLEQWRVDLDADEELNEDFEL